MQVLTTPRTSEPPAPTAVPRRRLLFPLASLTAAALVVAAVWVWRHDFPPSTVRTGLLVLAAVIAVTVVVMPLRALRRRSARRRSETSADVTEPTAVVTEEALPEEPGDPVPSEDPSSMSPRALSLYVRSLEGALARQDERLDETRRDAADRLEDMQHRERERVRLTVTAMRDVVADQDGLVAVNRLDTALRRLAAGSEGARPLLSPVPTGSMSVSFAVPRDHAQLRRDRRTVSTSDTAPDEAPDETPDETQGEAADPGHDPSATVPAEPSNPPVHEPVHGPDRVLPVPASADPAPDRSRRRRRRGAAV
jgi:hypothetical protein